MWFEFDLNDWTGRLFDVFDFIDFVNFDLECLESLIKVGFMTFETLAIPSSSAIVDLKSTSAYVSLPLNDLLCYLKLYRIPSGICYVGSHS